MKADHAAVGHVLADRRRFVVPVYQRHYQWRVDKHLEPFWQDVAAKAEERLASKGRRFDHYMGALIVLDDGTYEPRRVPTVQVVDGQQRLTTFQLFLAAARDLATARGYEAIAKDAEAHLINGGEDRMSDPDSERFKLEPTLFDQSLFRLLVSGDLNAIRKDQSDAFYKNGKLKTGSAPKTLAAFVYFREQLEKFALGDDAGDDALVQHRLSTVLSTLLADFRLVVITLQENDDAQVIFSTLNARGEPLLAMDLVRNDVFHRARLEDQDPKKLYKTLWSTFEAPFWEAEVKQGRFKKPRVEFFLANVLASETGEEISIGNLFPEWRSYVKSGRGGGVVNELQTLTAHAPAYAMLTDPQGSSPLAEIARTMRAFDVTTAYPVLLKIAKEQPDEEAQAAAFDLLASYVVRRAICDLGTKNYNNNFLRLVQTVVEAGPNAEALWETVSGWTGDASRFPDDAEFADAVLRVPAYKALGPARARWVLSKLEMALRTKFDEAVDLGSSLEVEHVMPRAWRTGWALPDERMAPANWWDAPADDAMATAIRARDVAVDTLGNLTLLTGARNASLSNGRFDDKRPKFQQSLLVLNRDIAQEEAWSEALIEARARRLATYALKLWPAPARTSVEA